MKFLTNQAGRRVAYDKVDGRGATIVFLGGLMSDRQGKKALFLESYARKNGLNFVRFDYFGHGDSDAKFQECGLDDWLESALLIIDQLTSGKVILVGSSLGGWISYLVTLLRSDVVVALLSLAPAPDFTENLMWDIFSDDVKDKINNGDVYTLPSDYCDGGYPITKKLIESGRKHLLLRGDGEVGINVPTTIIHGMKDRDVPFEYSIKLARKVATDEVRLVLLKDSDHSLSSHGDLGVVGAELDLISKRLLG